MSPSSKPAQSLLDSITVHPGFVRGAAGLNSNQSAIARCKWTYAQLVLSRGRNLGVFPFRKQHYEYGVAVGIRLGHGTKMKGYEADIENRQVCSSSSYSKAWGRQNPPMRLGTQCCRHVTTRGRLPFASGWKLITLFTTKKTTSQSLSARVQAPNLSTLPMCC
ncbi:hypothetical protein NEUTE1DRAFT_107294 [Neurospora tetrasperma FGSC 2508]|uniref:Uncharacterized protein n=1 Tax=Neurospora tetrasperma (strain FGSC 2508 / ATCC MYA-4615 / P0657) TaxID=510951 RepID=F8MDV9_NEUT8|nr:uncharacterized protein NEUTE1DRAFT_107294 [Neurospora tetrasperma FGSC 2508]EGO60696.1 hypothetical protein NEUTE1DRAFT_107294 [Neurospora tetrasperma FGSC 2508]EGZ75318.1 hypothetical protein NEUTE2DRAFT_136470 [Neurospora tetrasperma FGSC 2509]